MSAPLVGASALKPNEFWCSEAVDAGFFLLAAPKGSGLCFECHNRQGARQV